MHAVKQDQPFVARLKRLVEVPVGKRSEGSVRLLMPLLLLLAATVFLAFRPQSTLSVTDGFPEPAQLAVLTDTLPDGSPAPIIDTSPEPAAFPEATVAPSPEPAASPFPTPAPVIDPESGIQGPSPAASFPVGSVTATSPARIVGQSVEVQTAAAPQVDVATTVPVGSVSATVAEGIVAEIPGPGVAVAGAVQQDRVHPVAAARSVTPDRFNGNMPQLKRELLRNLLQDDLINNRAERNIVEYPGDRILVNGRELSAEHFAKYQEILNSYGIDPEPDMQVRIHPRYIMVGKPIGDSFHGHIHGNVDLSTDLH